MLKKVGVFFYSHQFKRNVMPAVSMQGYGLRPAFYRKVFDLLGMTPVKGFGNP